MKQKKTDKQRIKELEKQVKELTKNSFNIKYYPTPASLPHHCGGCSCKHCGKCGSCCRCPIPQQPYFGDPLPSYTVTWGGSC